MPNENDRSVPASKGKGQSKRPRTPKPGWRISFSKTKGVESKTISYIVRRGSYPAKDFASAVRIACWRAMREIHPRGVDWSHRNCTDILDWELTVEDVADTVNRNGQIVEVKP